MSLTTGEQNKLKAVGSADKREARVGKGAPKIEEKYKVKETSWKGIIIHTTIVKLEILAHLVKAVTLTI